MKDPQPMGFTPHGAPRRLGDFLIEEQIGRGGMGVVYRARRAAMGEVVALKLMAPEFADNDDYRARFIREARLGPSLDHPNIVPVHESGEVDGELFLVMKLVEGSDLKDVIRREGRLAPTRAMHIFRQAADALDAAHATGMVHRDVKPQNILVSRDASARGEHVYLTDFGLVRPVASETASRTGQVFGSVPYMSPELIEGLPADGRADVYALACVIFEALTGTVPYERENEVAALWAHVNEDPPLVTDRCPDVPGGVNDVLLKALAKHPDDRFLTCGEMVASLEIGLGRKLSQLKYAYVRPLVKRVPRRKTGREVWSSNYFPELSRVRSTTHKVNWWKAGAFAMACLLIASVQVGREGGIPEAISDVAGTAGSAGRSLIDAVVREDGDKSATSERRDRGRDLEPANEGSVLTAPGGIEVEGRGHGSEPTGRLTSPTLRSIAPADSVLARSLFVFSSDRRYPSSQRKFEGSMDLYVMNADGSGLRNLSARDATKSDTIPVLSPCRQLAFTRIHRDPLFTLYLLAPDGTTLLEEKDWEITNDVDWSPDCRQIVYRQERSLVIRDVYTSEKRVLISWSEGGSPRYPHWSPDGTRIAFSAGGQKSNLTQAEKTQIFVIDPDGTDLTQLTSTLDTDNEATWSPDGERIAFRRALKTGAGSDGDVWIMNADGSEQRQLTDSVGEDRPIGWSPDGRDIIFFTDRETRASAGPYYKGDIYVMHTDGTNERDLIPDGGGDEAWASWLPSVYRTISAGIEGRELSGRVDAMLTPCAVDQDLNIQRKEAGGWEAVGTVATTDSGSFAARVPSAGVYRTQLPLTKGRGGLVCGITASRALSAD